MKNYKSTINFHPLRSLLAAVCAWAILVSLVPPAMAAETEATIPVTTAPIEEATQEDGDLLAHLRAEIVAYMETYAISPEMPDSALANAYFVLDSNGAKAAWDTAHDLLDQAQELSAEDADALNGDVNTKLCLRFYDIMVRINTPLSTAGITGGENLPQGLSASGGNVFVWTVSDQKISVNATPSSSTSGCSTTYSSQEDHIILTTSAAATLAVQADITGTGTVTLKHNTAGEPDTIVSGTKKSYTLSENESVTITVKSGDSKDASLTLTLDYTYIPSGSEVKLSFQPVEGIPYTVNDTEVTDSAVTVSGDPADGFTVKANSANYILDSAELVDSAGTKTTLAAVESKLSPTTSGTVTPIFNYDIDADGVAPYLVGGTTYWDWDKAMAAASNSSGKLVVLNDDHTLSSRDSSYTIPSGVTFLIPFDSGNTLYTTEPEIHVSGTAFVDLSAQYTKPTAYRTLTMADGANITINGAMSLSGKQSPKQGYNGHPSGPLGFVNMQSGSSIIVNSGAFLYTWGYITGSGTVTAKSGSTVYECFQVTDWRGGTATGTMIDDDNIAAYQVFPMTQYYVQNIEVPLTLESGSKEIGYFSVVASKIKYGTTVPFVGEGSLFISESGASITKDYIESEDRLAIDVDGNLTMGSLSIPIASYKMNSADYVLPVTNNMTVNVNSGTTTVSQDMAFLPGSEVNIASGANFVLGEDINMFVYDSAEWDGKLFVYSSRDFSPIKYAPGKPTSVSRTAPGDAKINVAGTADVDAGYVYTTSGGAAITGEDGATASITQGLTDQKTYQYVQSISTYTEVPITSAKLKNGDGSYTATEDGAGTYKYSGTGENGRWILLKQLTYTNIKAGDCLDIFFYTDLYGEGYKAKVTRERANEAGAITYSTEYIPASQWSAYGNNQYRFAYQDIAAKEMSDTVTVTIYDEHDRQLTHPYSESVEGYAVRALEYYAGKTDMGLLQTALVDMLNYGAAAQSHFKNYRTDVYANRNIDSYQGFATADVTYVNKDVMDENESTYKLYGTTLTAESEVYLTFYFTGITAENKDSMSATAEYTTIYGKKVKQTIQGSDFNSYTDKDNNTTYYGPCVTGIAAADGKQTVSCTLNYGTGTTTVKSDIESYVARTIGETVDETTLDKLCLSLMKFVVSAKAYFESTMG